MAREFTLETRNIGIMVTSMLENNYNWAAIPFIHKIGENLNEKCHKWTGVLEQEQERGITCRR